MSINQFKSYMSDLWHDPKKTLGNLGATYQDGDLKKTHFGKSFVIGNEDGSRGAGDCKVIAQESKLRAKINDSFLTNTVDLETARHLKHFEETDSDLSLLKYIGHSTFNAIDRTFTVLSNLNLKITPSTGFGNFANILGAGVSAMIRAAGLVIAVVTSATVVITTATLGAVFKKGLYKLLWQQAIVPASTWIAGKIQQIAPKALEAIKTAARIIADTAKYVGKKAWEGLKAAAEWTYTHVIDAAKWTYDKILKPVGQAIMKVMKPVITALAYTLATTAGAAFSIAEMGLYTLGLLFNLITYPLKLINQDQIQNLKQQIELQGLQIQGLETQLDLIMAICEETNQKLDPAAAPNHQISIGKQKLAQLKFNYQADMDKLKAALAEANANPFAKFQKRCVNSYAKTFFSSIPEGFKAPVDNLKNRIIYDLFSSFKAKREAENSREAAERLLEAAGQ